MNSEIIRTSYDMFILHDEQPRTPLKKIYTIKYFSLLITQITIVCAQKFEKKLGNITTFQYVLYLLYITAFGISCFSSFIGHRKIYIFSYPSLIIFFVLVLVHDKLKDYLILILALRALRFILYIQVIIQIYGTWPQQFGRIFVEFYFSSQLILLILFAFNYQDILVYSLFPVIVINFVLIVKNVTNFKSPETDSVFKDFIRLLFNAKPLIFTILIGISELLLLVLLIKVIDSYNRSTYAEIFEPIVTIIIIIIIFITFQSKIRHNQYQPTFIVFISLILLLLVGSIFIILDFYQIEVNYFLYFIIVLIELIWLTHKIPQYQTILLNIGIRNLDFAPSYSLLTFGIIQITISFFFKKDFPNQFIQGHISRIIICLIGIIIILSIIFYLLLGFYQYFKKSNRSQVEENEFQIQEI